MRVTFDWKLGEEEVEWKIIYYQYFYSNNQEFMTSKLFPKMAFNWKTSTSNDLNAFNKPSEINHTQINSTIWNFLVRKAVFFESN